MHKLLSLGIAGAALITAGAVIHEKTRDESPPRNSAEQQSYCQAIRDWDDSTLSDIDPDLIVVGSPDRSTYERWCESRHQR